MKHNIRVIGISEEEKEQGIATLFEKIMTENFLNLERGKATQVQEAQSVSIKMNSKKPTPRHIIIKMLNVRSSSQDGGVCRYTLLPCSTKGRTTKNLK